MGEPFDNYDSVISAVRTLVDPEVFGLSAKHVTISTGMQSDQHVVFDQDTFHRNRISNLGT